MPRTVSGTAPWIAAALCAAFTLAPAWNRAQRFSPGSAVPPTQFTTSAPQSSTTGSASRFPSAGNTQDDAADMATARLRQAQMARLQNNDRQERIVDDTDKLLRLATELKADVDKSNKHQLSLEVIRKAEEVEKLAHDVKVRMRG